MTRKNDNPSFFTATFREAISIVMQSAAPKADPLDRRPRLIGVERRVWLPAGTAQLRARLDALDWIE